MKIAENSVIYRVSDLNHNANTLLSKHFSQILVSGEISNLSRPTSGHLYFSLKDERAQIRCALFRFQHQQINFALENGQQVIVCAMVNIYEPRGDFQLIVSDVQLAGLGQLQIAFEKLKKELEARGLFDEQYKKALPIFPKQIGVITSVSAAALQDILKVLKKRSPQIPILIYPALVQGNLAAAEIAKAIACANQEKLCDVLILARGGGSLEDLWPFNEATVAHAIFESRIPIITGIGHQTDFTLADFVADVRAPTPSAAAEMVSPDQEKLAETLTHYYQRLLQSLYAQFNHAKAQVLHLEKRLQHPAEKLRLQAQQLDQLENNLVRCIKFKLTASQEKILHYSQSLDHLSPVKILQRGFSITKNQNNTVITQVTDTHIGDVLVTTVTDGAIVSVVQQTTLNVNAPTPYTPAPHTAQTLDRATK